MKKPEFFKLKYSKTITRLTKPYAKSNVMVKKLNIPVIQKTEPMEMINLHLCQTTDCYVAHPNTRDTCHLAIRPPRYCHLQKCMSQINLAVKSVCGENKSE
jgi:hypothetical protein